MLTKALATTHRREPLQYRCWSSPLASEEEHGSRIYYSPDDGEMWQHLKRAATRTYVHTVATMYAGFTDEPFHRTADGKIHFDEAKMEIHRPYPFKVSDHEDAWLIAVRRSTRDGDVRLYQLTDDDV